MSDTYEVYALRYATRESNSSELFMGDQRQLPMMIDYFTWAITNGERTVLVDLGYTEAVGDRRGGPRTYLRDPARGLAEIGLDAESVEDVVVTHFHYDHTGHHAAFPNARFHVQEREMAFYTGRYASEPTFAQVAEVDDVLAYVRLNYDGRVSFVDGEAEIAPGISVHHVGGHTPGMQVVSVQTARGRAVLASDASHFYRNFEDRVPFHILADLPGYLRALSRLYELADAPDLIVPGHDPLVLERLTPVGDGIVRL